MRPRQRISASILLSPSYARMEEVPVGSQQSSHRTQNHRLTPGLRCRTVALSLAAVLGVVLAGVASPTEATTATQPGPQSAPSYLADAYDPAVTTLAKDLGLPIEEAQRRIGWQDPAIQLGNELRTALGERFGGLWLDEADGGRVKIGIVGGTLARATTQAQVSISRWGLGSVSDLVPVRHGYAQLERDSAWLGLAVSAANKTGGAELSSATQVDRNRLVLRTPAGKTLTATQQATVETAKARLGSRLILQTWSGSVQRQACAWHNDGFNCDAPLRGGVDINTTDPKAGSRCTTAFNARSNSDGRWYVMTAGHCGAVGTEFQAYQPRTGRYHVIGDVHNRRVADNDDYSIIRINNVAGWNPRNWVYVHASSDTVRDPNYTIDGISTSPVGTRVCMTGSVSGTDCGKVLEVNLGGAGGLARASYCAEPGDSGGAIYSGHKARGIHLGRLPGDAGSCVDSVFQGITEAANELNVHVVTN